MNDEQHLSTDQLAGLLDGSLPASEQMSAQAHLVTCDECARARDDQEWVAALLAEDASDPLPMPSQVSLRLDMMIERAAHERATAATPIEEARRRRGTRSLRWLTGAAAAVVVAAVGVAGWQLADHGGTGTASNAAVGGTKVLPTHEWLSGAAPSEGPPVDNKNAEFGPRVSAGNLSAYARVLSAQPGRRIPPRSARCAEPIAGMGFSVVQWHQHPAVLALNPETRIVTVYDCKTGVRSLFDTGY